MLNLPIEWIAGAAGFIGLVVAYFVKLASKKEEGRQEVLHKQIDLDLKNLIKLKEKSEKLRAQTNKDKSCIPNDWDELDKLSAKNNASTLSQISSASVCTEVHSVARPNKENEPS